MSRRRKREDKDHVITDLSRRFMYDNHIYKIDEIIVMIQFFKDYVQKQHQYITGIIHDNSMLNRELDRLKHGSSNRSPDHE